MSHMHTRVSNLEAATAKNEADVATTMNALATTTAAHATTAAAVAEIGITVTDAVDDLVGCHLGSLKPDVSSLGQDVLALCTLLATMHGKPPQPAAPPPTATLADNGTIPTHKPTAVVAVPPLQEAQPPDADDKPPPAAAGMTRPMSKLFPHVDSTNLHVDVIQRGCFHAHTINQRLPTGRRNDDNVASSDGDRWAPGCQQNWYQCAPPPIRSSSANPYHPSRPHIQGPCPHEPQMFSDEDNASLGGSISPPRHIDCCRQAANTPVSQFDIAVLAKR